MRWRRAMWASDGFSLLGNSGSNKNLQNSSTGGTRRAPSMRYRWQVELSSSPISTRSSSIWYLQDTEWHWATRDVPSSCHTKHCQPAATKLPPGHSSEGVSGTQGAWFCCCCYGVCFVSCSTEFWVGPSFASSRARFFCLLTNHKGSKKARLLVHVNDITVTDRDKNSVLPF